MAITIASKRARKILAHQFGGVTEDATPGTWYMGLSVSPINADGSGVKEPTIDASTSAPYGYKRMVIANTSGAGGSWELGSGMTVSNAKSLEFLEFEKDIVVPGTTGYQRATHAFLSTSPTDTSANAIEWICELKESRPLEKNSIVAFNTGDLVFEIANPTT